MSKTPLLILAGCFLAIVSAFIFDSCISSTASADEAPLVEEVNTQAWMEPQSSIEPLDLLILCEELDEHQLAEADVPEYEISRQEMIADIMAIWEIYFEDENVRLGDPRRPLLEENATFLADAIIMYQNEPTDIGGQLPRHYSTHYLLATMVTLESAVDPNVKEGALGEVGMLQIHGKRALAGYDPEVVKKNPRLGLLLGVRWLASCLPTCYPDGIESLEWNSSMWIGPMSLYAAGGRAMRKDGTCGKVPVARKRVDLARMYKPRVEYERPDDV